MLNGSPLLFLASLFLLTCFKYTETVGKHLNSFCVFDLNMNHLDKCIGIKLSVSLFGQINWEYLTREWGAQEEIVSCFLFICTQRGWKLGSWDGWLIYLTLAYWTGMHGGGTTNFGNETQWSTISLQNWYLQPHQTSHSNVISENAFILKLFIEVYVSPWRLFENVFHRWACPVGLSSYNAHDRDQNLVYDLW